MSKINVKQPEPPAKVIPFEVLAESIVQISNLGKQIQESRLSRRCIALLIKDRTGVGMGEIDKILNALPLLEKTYCKATK